MPLEHVENPFSGDYLTLSPREQDWVDELDFVNPALASREALAAMARKAPRASWKNWLNRVIAVKSNGG